MMKQILCQKNVANKNIKKSKLHEKGKGAWQIRVWWRGPQAYKVNLNPIKQRPKHKQHHFSLSFANYKRLRPEST